MTILHPYFEFEMRPAAAISLRRLSGWTVTAVDGRIWLTEENGGRDIWLQAGDRHFIKGRGRVVVEPWLAGDAAAGGLARVRLTPPRAAHAERSGKPWRLRWPGLAVPTIAGA